MLVRKSTKRESVLYVRLMGVDESKITHDAAGHSSSARMVETQLERIRALEERVACLEKIVGYHTAAAAVEEVHGILLLDSCSVDTRKYIAIIRKNQIDHVFS